MLSMGSLYNNNAYSPYASSYPTGSGMATGAMTGAYPSSYSSPLTVTQTTTTTYQVPTYTPPVVCMMPVVCYMPVMAQMPVMTQAPVATPVMQSPVGTIPQVPASIPPISMPTNYGSSYPATSPYTNYQTPAPAPTPTMDPTQSTIDSQSMSMLLPLLLQLVEALLQNSQPPTATEPTPEPAPTPAPTPSYTPPTYNGGGNGNYWGDPHLVGFDGEKYDVMGQPGKTYNMLSDEGVQYNTTFAKWGSQGATVISKAGIQVGDQKIYFDRSGDAPTINGQAMIEGDDVALPDGGSASWDGTKLTVKTQEYTIDLEAKDLGNPKGAYLESHVSINDGGPFSDFVAPHGLLGQTADGVAGQKDTGHDQGDQGGTVIDGTVADYEEADLWSHSDKFSRFGVQVDSVQTQTDADGNVIKTFDMNGNVLFDHSVNPLSVAA
jgi:hypothetical protein